MGPRPESQVEHSTPACRDGTFSREFKLFPTEDTIVSSPNVEYLSKMFPGLVSMEGIFGRATNKSENGILSGWDGPTRAAHGSSLGLKTKEFQERRDRARTPVKFDQKSPQTNSLRSVVGSVKTESVLERVMRSGSKPATFRRLPTAGRYKPRSPTTDLGSSNRADYFSVPFDEETKQVLKKLGEIILRSSESKKNATPVCESCGTPKEHPDVKSSRSQKFTSATSRGEPSSGNRGLFGTDFGAAISHLGQLNSKMLPSFQTSYRSAFSEEWDNKIRKGRSLTESTNLHTDENSVNDLEILSTCMIENLLDSPESDGCCYRAPNARTYEPSSEENVQHWDQQAAACQGGACWCRKKFVSPPDICQWHEDFCRFGAQCTPEQPDSPPLSDEMRQQIDQLQKMGLQMLKLRRLWGTVSTAASRDECQVTRFRRDAFLKQLFGIAGHN